MKLAAPRLPTALVILAAALCPGLAEAAGTVLSEAPPVPPGRVAPLPADPLRAAIQRTTQGDLAAAAWYEQQLLDQGLVTGRTRAAVQLALGIARMRLGDLNAAAEAFTKVKGSGTPVAAWGTWYLAKAEHARGHHAAAATACGSYRSRWPDGPFADECLVLMGDAYVAAGNRSGAVGAYSKYLELHPDSPLEETLHLGIAMAISTTDPKAAIPMLQALTVDHAYHSTGQTAERRLGELAAKGFDAKVPDSVEWQCKQAIEEKRCGFEDQAWTRYQALAAKAEEDPELQAWIDAQEERFAWGTKQYETLARTLAEAYAQSPTADLAWDRYKALARAGLWVEAAKQLEDGTRAHPTASNFRGARELYARALLLAGRYADATTAWTTLGKTGGALGRESRFLAAYAAFRAGNHEDALTRLAAVVNGGGDEALAGRYYRARVLDALGRPDEATAERADIRRTDPLSWYAVMLASETLPKAGPSAATPGTGLPVTGTEAVRGDDPARHEGGARRDGRWPGEPAPTLPVLARVGTAGPSVARPVVSRTPLAPVADALTSAPSPVRASHVDWSALAWASPSPSSPSPSSPPPSSAVAAHPRPAALPPGVTALGPDRVTGETRPDSYAAGFLYDPAAGDKALCALGDRYGALFPWATAAADLARAGIYDEAAPVVARMYDAIEAAEDGAPLPASPVLGKSATREQLRAVDVSTDDWRQIFYFVHDDYHAARFSWGTGRYATNDAERAVALRRAFPTAEVDALYRQGQSEDVDPFLVLGLMRQESVYRQWALSPVGAIGLLQVMPRTGARVAALMGDPHYSPDILEDPSTNVRYGVWYLGRLLDRFEGAYPLAVASYNGGPHNVSSWLRPWGTSIRMDDFVEQIPYGESKNYVKKVTGYYATYLSLYAPEGTRIEVPPTPRGDHADVINF